MADKEKYIDVWIVDGKNVVSAYGSQSEAARKARAEPGATVHKQRWKVRQDASNAEIQKAYQSAATGYSERKGCILWTLIYISICLSPCALILLLT